MRRYGINENLNSILMEQLILPADLGFLARYNKSYASASLRGEIIHKSKKIPDAYILFRLYLLKIKLNFPFNYAKICNYSNTFQV